MYDKKLQDRIKWKYLTESHPNFVENRKVAERNCKDNILFYINNFAFTYDPRGNSDKEKHLPFILYDYQELAIVDLVDHIMKGKDQLWEKSRDMGASWCIAVVADWGWKYHGWDILMGSRKEDLVDKRGDRTSLIEKIRYIESRLPDWMNVGLREGITDKTMLLQHPVNKNTITGESNNPYFGTGGRYKFVLLDEFSKWEQTDEVAWRSLGDATPCRVANSTPSERGTNCHFYKLIEQGIDRVTMHWVNHPKKNIGLYYLNLEDKVYLNPNKPGDIEKALELWKAGIRVGSEWYDKECERRSEIEIAQELDINYNASLAGAIFNKFDFKTQVADIKYNPNLPLYVAWDFGMDTTALIWIQTQGIKDYIIDEYVNKGEDIFHYIEVANAKSYKQAIHFGDPYSGGVKQMQSASTVAQILMRQGIRMRLASRVSINDRINASRIRLKDTIVSKSCPLFLDMIANWRFKKPIRNTDKPLPEHSQFSHLGEAHGYFSVGMSMSPANIIKSRYSK